MKTIIEDKENFILTQPVSQKLQRKILNLRHNFDIRVLALGDSSVFGVGDTAVDGKADGPGWAGRIKHDLDSKNYLNLGKNGARAATVANEQVLAADYFEPDLTLICVGTNDVVRGNFSPKQIGQSLVKIIDYLNERGSVVVLLGLPDSTQIAFAPKRFKRVLRERISVLNDLLSDAALQRDAVYISGKNYKTLLQRDMWHVDRMHPSSRGYQAIATWVREALGLPLRASQSLETKTERTRKDEMHWLLVNGSKWFFKRCFDFFPVMLYLMIFGLRKLEKESIKGWQIL